ncbi:MAG: hypothetical protein ABJI96_05245 [Paracoccaceae bacterium]
MPHAELKYSNDLQIDAVVILAAIEQTILRHDAGSGECKGRAYPTDIFHHSHLILNLSMLKKAHRDSAFTAALMTDLEQIVKENIPQSCFFSFTLEYSKGTYVTNFYEGTS